jgi:6-phosphogluconate dehydrogenase (decarboxylating)
LAQLAHESQTYSIKIAGSGKYAQLIEYGIETAEMAKYNENKIEIEVIE